jgi:hypothetical protein
MEFINVRQLTRNLKESTLNLPVTVTQFGKPVFMIVPFVASSEKNSIKISENFGKATYKSVPSAEGAESLGFCSFSFCSNKATGVRDGQLFCEEHL